LSQPEPEIPCREIADDEIDLVELFLILWKRKWMIVIFTLLLTIAAAGVSMILPKVYEVTAILEPAADAEGKLVENPQAIRENITGGAYNQSIVESLGLPAEEIPDLKVIVPKNTDLIKISMQTQEPETGVKILNQLITEVSSRLQEKLEVLIAETKNKVKSIKLKGQSFEDNIKLLKGQINQIGKKMEELENGRKAALASPKDDALAVLLYSNEIQTQQVYLNDLQQKLTAFENNKKSIQIEIDNIKLKLSNIKGTNINKQPSIPEKPIKPKKTLIVALAFVLGFMGSIMLAFLAEFMNKVRLQQVESESGN